MRYQAARWALRALVLGFIGFAFWQVLDRLPGRLHWGDVWARRAALLDGLQTTAVISLGAMVVGLAFGALGCMLRIARVEVLRFVGACYVEIVRNTPLLVQIYIAYYCIFRQAGSAWLVGPLTLGVFAGAYVAEILRAGIESIDHGQTEAALSLGLTPAQAMVHVVAPQAVRRVIPPLAGQFVSLVKDSSLLSVISIGELTFRAKETAAASYRYIEFYVALAILYLVITFPLSRFAAWLENRLRTGRRRR